MVIVNAYLDTESKVHKEMTINHSDVWGYGTFDQFMKEFHKKKWEHTSRWPQSYFDRGTKSEIHASIIRFDGKGMVLKLSEYNKVREFLKVNRVSGYRKGIWS
jgi:hypothetical protein